MEKYSKNKLVAKRYVFVFIILFVLLIVFLSMYLYKIITTDVIMYENVDRSASNISEEEATNATPIILNNIVIGGVYNGKFVDSLKYYQYSKYKKETEIDVFTQRGKSGTFVINEIVPTGNKYDTVYANIIKNDYMSEYYAVAKDTSAFNEAIKIEITNENKEEYIKSAKKAIKKYNYMNDTMKIQEAYSVTLSFDKKYTLLFVTNDGNTAKGVFSAVVAIPFVGNDAKCIKYNYYKDIENARDFGIYSFKFVGDLNADGTSEIIIQSMQEFTTTYSIIKCKNDDFFEILSSTIAIE